MATGLRKLLQPFPRDRLTMKQKLRKIRLMVIGFIYNPHTNRMSVKLRFFMTNSMV